MTAAPSANASDVDAQIAGKPEGDRYRSEGERQRQRAAALVGRAAPARHRCEHDVPDGQTNPGSPSIRRRRRRRGTSSRRGPGRSDETGPFRAASAPPVASSARSCQSGAARRVQPPPTSRPRTRVGCRVTSTQIRNGTALITHKSRRSHGRSREPAAPSALNNIKSTSNGSECSKKTATRAKWIQKQDANRQEAARQTSRADDATAGVLSG